MVCIVCNPLAPHPSHSADGGLSLLTNFQKKWGRAWHDLKFLEEGCWERGGDFFLGGGGVEVAILTQKNKLESKVLNNKNKFITKMFLSFISLLKNSIFKGGRFMKN